VDKNQNGVSLSGEEIVFKRRGSLKEGPSQSVREKPDGRKRKANQIKKTGEISVGKRPDRQGHIRGRPTKNSRKKRNGDREKMLRDQGFLHEGGPLGRNHPPEEKKKIVCRTESEGGGSS